ncbi:MAG: hypothetical protein ABJC10_05735 [Acidobacteriota bacterium]
MKGKAHAREVKAQAIAELIAGDSPTLVAASYGLPRKSVSNWKAALTPEQLAEVSRNTDGQLDELVGDHVATVLETLSAQAKAAGDLAKLHGTMFENTFSMLERFKLWFDNGGFCRHSTVKEWMGWSDSRFVTYYSHATMKSKAKAGRSLERLAGQKIA